MGELSLEDFLQRLTQSREETDNKIRESIGETPESLIAQQWIINNLLQGLKREILRKKNTQIETEKIKLQAYENKLNALKAKTTTDRYGDEYNKSVCLRADERNISLIKAEEQIKQEMYLSLSNDDLQKFLEETYFRQDVIRLKSSFLKCINKVLDPEKAAKLTLLLFELDQIKLDETWEGKKLEEELIAGLNGKEINLVTVMCLINNFDYKGGYTPVSDLYAYAKNSKLENIPKALDELNKLMSLFDFYGIKTGLFILIADTDYTEIGRYGPVKQEYLPKIDDYLKNIEQYVVNFNKDIAVLKISDLISKSLVYREVKKRVLFQVTQMDDIDFVRKWYQKFEDSLEKIVESQQKKKLYPKNSLREKSLEITRNIWACYAGQGALISEFGEGTIFVSTEKRERDLGYVVDSEIKKKFVPVIYVINPL